MLRHMHDLTGTLKLTHLHRPLVLFRLFREIDRKAAVQLTLLLWFELGRGQCAWGSHHATLLLLRTTQSEFLSVGGANPI